jgi:hypothetical protein
MDLETEFLSYLEWNVDTSGHAVGFVSEDVEGLSQISCTRCARDVSVLVLQHAMMEVVPSVFAPVLTEI